MSQYNLNKMLGPESVAVVGATDRPGTVGCVVLENLKAGGFRGPIFPINPKRERILDLDAFPSIGAVGKPIDLALICTPMASVPAVIEECAAASVGSAIVYSAGGKEIGEEGAAIEERIHAAAMKGRIRILGPNCMGLSVGAVNLNASFFHAMPLRGRVAFVAQSGAMCSTVLDYGLGERIGFSHFVSVGSMIDVDFADLIDYFGNDRDVSSILLYIEGIRETRKFLSAARAVSRIKPIIVLKSGRSQAGAAAAQSHTGALAGEDLVYDAAFRRAGIIRVNMLVDLFSCADLLDKQTLPQGPNMAIITVAGGLGVMMADSLVEYGLEPARLRPETIEALDRYCPPLWSHGNPIDATGAMKFEDIPKLISICAEAEEIDAISVIFIPNGLFPPVRFAELMVSRKVVTDKPIFLVLPGGEQANAARNRLTENGFPTFPSPESAVRSFYYLYEYQRSLQMLTEVPRPTGTAIKVDRQAARSLVDNVMGSGRSLMTEFESKALLGAYGIPVNETHVAETSIRAVELARKIGYPVAAKVHSHTITHKTDVGGIRLDLRNADDVIDAFAEIQEAVKTRAPEDHFGGITVQKMAQEKGYEVILGSKLDPDFGPVLVFGMGGVMTEIIQDREVGLPPLNRLLARRMIDSTKVFKLLKGFRGRTPADLDLLEEILIRLGQLVTDFPEIRELDINPLLATENRAYALDARVVLGPPARPAPWHMALSTYPEEYEEEVESREKGRLMVRPVRPEDAPSLMDFFVDLSEKSRLGKLVRRFEDFDERFVARLTQIDYDRDMVLVAVTGGEIVGLARYFGDPDLIEAEVSITIADAWQGQGVGASLLDLILKAAGKRGFRKAWGLCRPQSRDMISLVERQRESEVISVEDGRRMKLLVDLTTYRGR
ncbi:MAG: bifunctional acetate--CoA ligase family protein/GNAT family N-acetyltransferase [Deltaproteobacteria bacterium]|nr:bifunctional acetate--CoA ligase family protein/GNAT family N-acetyltransferase [Deltaproteobacteria bacterium]